MDKKYKKIFIISGLLAVFVLLAYFFSLINSLEDKITDKFFIKRQPSSEIIIIAIDDQSIRAIGQWPWPRETFSLLLKKINKARSISIDINFSEISRLGSYDDSILGETILEADPKIILPYQIDKQTDEQMAPIEILRKGSFLGSTNITLDSDGIVRKIIKEANQKLFAEEVVGIDLSFGEHVINYRGPEKTFATFSFNEVLNDSISERFFEEKIVLIGVTALDLQDFFQTPFGRISGVELHANLADNILENNFLEKINKILGSLFILVTIFVTVVFMFRLKKLFFILLQPITLLIFVYFITFLFFEYGVILPHLYISLGIFLAGAVVVSYQYMAESKEKRFIRKTFQYYLAPEIVAELIKDPAKLKLGGEKKKVTILFSDLRDFTSISETLPAEELMSRLNEYFDLMSDVVILKRGMVDKYIGDSLMSYWGAPLENKNQVFDACRSIVLMSEKLSELNQRWLVKGWQPFSAGYGLSTEEVIVGNTGSKKRFDYSIVGDGVNFTSRLEGLNKEYGTKALISESTMKEIEASDEFVTREIDTVIVKGKKEPKRIFELLLDKFDDDKKAIFGYFKEGKEYYVQGKWSEAIECFQKALDIGKDGPSKLFLERSKELKENPKPNWNGIFEFKNK